MESTNVEVRWCRNDAGADIMPGLSVSLRQFQESSDLAFGVICARDTARDVWHSLLKYRPLHTLSRFVDEMPNARLVWVEECGHVPHLEQPTKTAAEITDFIKNGNPAKVKKSALSGMRRGTESARKPYIPCANCDGGI